MKKIFKLMSDSAGSSSSRVAMAIAFKRARHKFPIHFGSSKNAENANQSLDTENPQKVPSTKAPTTLSTETYDQDTDRLESNLVESFEHVKVTEEIDDVLCEACLQDSQHFTNLDETAKSINKVAFENDDCVKSQRPIVVHINNSKNIFESAEPAVSEEDQSTSCQEERSYSFVWNEAPIEDLVKLDRKQPICIDESKGKSHLDANAAKRTVEVQPRVYERKRRSHRCSKKRSQDGNYQAYNIDELPRTQSCMIHHCHCHHRHCCCRVHCCWSRCCYWREPQVTLLTPSASESSSRRSSTVSSEPRKQKCSVCRKARRAGSPAASKASLQHAHRESCSRDSGIFTHIRYENDEFEREEDEDDDDHQDNALKHKDSLSILQEKYHKVTAEDGHRRRRSDPQVLESRSHKFCKRLLAKCQDISY